MTKSINELPKEIQYYAVCPECNFKFGSGCRPYNPSYRPTLATEFFNDFFNSGKAESICPRCEELVTEDDIYKN